jgi:3-phosphoshikimate 1-carboxyvinyltransferase
MIIDTIPGDKSVSHRAIIIGALAHNKSVFKNFLFSEDCLNSLNIFRQLGVTIDSDEKSHTVIVDGVGLNGLKKSDAILDVGNSGTGIRLITGVLAGQPFESIITGDSSIQKRPMARIMTPLSQMGAAIISQNDNGMAPLIISPSPNKLKGIHYDMPVASAQVKSAILFASLFADGKTTIVEPKKCRDHTERMLAKFGADIQVNGTTITCSGEKLLTAPDEEIIIPSDVSSAAFFIVLGLIKPNTQITIKNVGLNPTRATIIQVLEKMGAKIEITNIKDLQFEPYGNVTVETSELQNITVPKEIIPFIIDELPILAVAALFGTGTLTVTGAKELRVKESDRIESIAAMVTAFGGTIETYEDGFIITPASKLKQAQIKTHKDHRIAMSAFIAAEAANIHCDVDDADCIKTSFPNFFEILEKFK